MSSLLFMPACEVQLRQLWFAVAVAVEVVLQLLPIKPAHPLVLLSLLLLLGCTPP
jgi:predicted cobalt transporter CbtA